MFLVPSSLYYHLTNRLWYAVINQNCTDCTPHLHLHQITHTCQTWSPHLHDPGQELKRWPLLCLCRTLFCFNRRLYLPSLKTVCLNKVSLFFSPVFLSEFLLTYGRKHVLLVCTAGATLGEYGIWVLFAWTPCLGFPSDFFERNTQEVPHSVVGLG